MLVTKYWTKWTSRGIIFSIGIWIIFVLGYSQIYTLSPDFYGIGVKLFQTSYFYLLALLVPVTCLLLDVTVTYINRNYFPDPAQILREVEYQRQISGEEIGTLEEPLEDKMEIAAAAGVRSPKG